MTSQQGEQGCCCPLQSMLMDERIATIQPPGLMKMRLMHLQEHYDYVP